MNDLHDHFVPHGDGYECPTHEACKEYGCTLVSYCYDQRHRKSWFEELIERIFG